MQTTAKFPGSPLLEHIWIIKLLYNFKQNVFIIQARVLRYRACHHWLRHNPYGPLDLIQRARDIRAHIAWTPTDLPAWLSLQSISLPWLHTNVGRTKPVLHQDSGPTVAACGKFNLFQQALHWRITLDNRCHTHYLGERQPLEEAQLYEDQDQRDQWENGGSP